MKKILINAAMVLCFLVALGCGGYLAFYYYGSNKSENKVDNLRKKLVEKQQELPLEKEEASVPMVEVNGVFVQEKFETLYRENPDFVGWITIEDTNIDYPVMYTPGDGERGEYYIHRDFDEQYSAPGTPFIDSSCQLNPATDNVIVYGHNMNSGKMFHDLLMYEDEAFYEAHKTFSFDTIYGDGTYEVISVFRGEILPDDSKEFKYYEFVNAGNEEEFMEYVEQVQRMSLYDTKVPVEYGDHLVTLSTCAYHVRDGRFAVVAKKLDE